MLLKEWRLNQGWSLAKMAEALHLAGRYPAETVRRWEGGESRPDADAVARIEVVTAMEVTAVDMHEVRLFWLKQTQPQRFESLEAAE